MHGFSLRTRPADQITRVPQPRIHNPCRVSHDIRFSLFRFRSPLLSESLLFSLPTGTEMFHFPAFPPHTLYIQVQVTGHDSSQVSPFGHPRITARLPTPQGLSQATTSFIGSRCQGIHHVPFIACQTPQTHPGTKKHRGTPTASNAHKEQSPHPQSKGRDHLQQHCKQKCNNKNLQQNCYKDARVHYEKTKHHTQQPPTTNTQPTAGRSRHQDQPHIITD